MQIKPQHMACALSFVMGTAAFLLLTELLSFWALNAIATREMAKVTGEENHPAYKNEPWAAAYWSEHRMFLSQSYTNYPYGLWRLKPFKGRTINVGTDGLRITTNVTCDGSAPLIAIYGSSLVWGQGSPDWLTIPSLVAKRFADDGTPVCVVNHGTDAWRSSENVIQLIEDLRLPGSRRPAAAVFIDSCNDVFTPFLYTGKVDEPYNFKKGWLDALAQIHRGSFYWLTATNTWTLLEKQVFRRLFRSKPPVIKDPDVLGRQVADLYLENLKIVDGLSRSFGFSYHLFWLPLGVDDQADIYRTAVEKTQPAVHAGAGDHLHDLTGAYGQDVMLGICHVVPAGNAIIADRVYQALKRDMHALQ